MPPVLVRTSLGSVSGSEYILPNQKKMYAFCGIPYALPPRGELRFRSPVPLVKFPKIVMDCTEERGISIQRDNYKKEITGTEDCLFLNIYTPQLPHTCATSFPVMVWIHGGGFMTGSGNKEMFSPDCLVQEGVVVVTINYRLGPLGFLSMPKAGISGNAGLKDQLLALKFVNQHIENFCGDPTNVTLFGESAGASSVHMHYMSKKSRKYIHKAICQSGVFFNEWAWQFKAEDKARILAEELGLKSTVSDLEVVEFLTKVPAFELAYSSLKTLDTEELCRSIPMPFRPVIEEESDDAFVTQEMVDNWRRQNVVDIPLMMGYNSLEGMLLLPFKFKLNMMLHSFSETLPRSLNLTLGSKSSITVAEQIKHFYFGTNAVSEDNLQALVDILSDYYFNVVFVMAAETIARYQHKSKLYFYRFSYDGSLNFAKKIHGRGNLSGATHADELFYLFKASYMGDDYEPDEEAKMVRSKMCRMWTNFAKFSEPTPKDDDTFDEKWFPVNKIHPRSGSFNLDYYDINKSMQMKCNPDWERILFWRGIYEKWNEGFLKPKL